MKHLNPVENILAGLKPRDPSPELRGRIFKPAPARPEVPALFAFTDYLRWVVPAVSCLVLALVSLDPVHPNPYEIAGTNDLLPETHKAQYSAYLPGASFHSPMNSVPVTRVESRVAPAASSTFAILQFTNSLNR